MRLRKSIVVDIYPAWPVLLSISKGGIVQPSADGFTNFTGVLVKRQYKSGQKYIQLVFETAEGIHLSLSRNIDMVRSLTVGNTYKVRGQEFSLGKKKYIHEPLATPVEISKSFFRKNLKFIVITGLIVSIAGVSAAALKFGGDKPAGQIANTSKNSTVSSTNTSPSASTDAPADSTAQAAPVTTATSTPTVKRTMSTKSTSSSGMSTPAVNSPASSQPEAPAVTTPTIEEPEVPVQEPTEPDPTVPVDPDPPVETPAE